MNLLLDNYLFCIYNKAYSNYSVKGDFVNNLFSIGELAGYQNISKQTLIFYDKIGLFKPAYVDPSNHYRYYTAQQIDYLDTILIMKEMGFSLAEIQEHMKTYTIDTSLVALHKQLTVLEQQIAHLQLVRSRLAHRCAQMERVKEFHGQNQEVTIREVGPKYLLCSEVEQPQSFREISIATKKCFSQALQEELPIFFQTGVIVPYAHIRQGRYTQASVAFLPIEKTKKAKNIRLLPKGQVVRIYHCGDYPSVNVSYEKLLQFCRERELEIISDSYEFCINDYISSGDEKEYITEIMFYIREKESPKPSGG